MGKISKKIILRDDFPKKDGTARIDYLIYFEGRKYRVYSGKSVEPKYWRHELECVDKKCDNAAEINQELQKSLAEFDSLIKRKNILGEKLELDELKSILKGSSLDKAKRQSEIKKHPLISEAIDNYVNFKEMKPGSKTNYMITKRVLLDFCQMKYKKEMTIDKIDFEFLERLKKYLREERDIPNQLNTIAKRFKLLKTAVRYSIKSGYKIEDPFVDYPIEHGKSKDIALTVIEYEQLCHTEIPKSACASLRLARDIFVFCCETGLRYSDAMDLSWEHINSKMTAFEKIQIKTTRKVFVPISKRAEVLLKAYKRRYEDAQGHVFPRIDNQVMNRYLKELAILCGTNKNLTTHVARHTFGTRLGATGKVSAFEICDLMGHSDVHMSQKYINLSKDDLMNTMNRVWGKI